VLGLVCALALVADQFVEETAGHRSQFGETLRQQGKALLRVLEGMMAGADLPLRGERPRQQHVLGDIFQVGSIDENLVFGDPDRQQAADRAPGNCIEVLPIGDEAFGVDRTVEHPGGVVRWGGQRDQVRYFPGVACQRCFLGLPMDADIGYAGLPLLGDLVELCQGGESPAVEKARFDIVEGSFYLTLGWGRRGWHAHGLKP